MRERDAPAKGAAAVRSAVRLVRLGAVLARSAAEIALLRRDPPRACQAAARRLLRVMGVRLRVAGKIPARGLIVCNHLSYLDILVIAAVTPVRFVAKSEVRSWPAVGWFARRLGAVFVEREGPAAADRAVRELADVLRRGEPVVLFPEGTSSDGRTVLPFKSSLFAAAGGAPRCAAAVSYALGAGEGDPAEVVCYWRDMTLLPHLLRLLGRRRIWAALAFAPLPGAETDRKELARESRARVAGLKSAADALCSSAASSAPTGPRRRRSGLR